VPDARPSTLSPERSAKRGFRGDIQGMRAVAVLLVMLWHAGVGVLPGGFVGVDVFFVVSGFLMTGILLRDQDSERGISLLSFYARRARRLLPASLCTLAVVGLVGWWLLPPLRRWDLLADIAASSAFGMNWRMSNQAVDYLAATTGPPSALQHFWSLGVEEQFYFVWPVLLMAAGALALRLGISRRRVVGAAMLVVLAVSFAYSVHETSTNPAQAYFVTWTRVWELAVGALAALVADRWTRLPRRVAAPAGWLGLAAIIVAAVRYDETTPFPGSAALLPVLGAALVVLSGPAAGSKGPVLLLGVKPMRRIGDWSYSLYLWHWPPLVFTAVVLERDLGVRAGLLVVAASFIPAYLSYRFIEEPARRATWSRGHWPALGAWGGLAAATLGIALVAGLMRPEVVQTDGSLANALTMSERRPQSVSNLGAGALDAKPRGDRTGAPRHDATFYPQPEQLPDTQFGCITPYTVDEVETCDYAATDSDTRVVLAGDSHAVQWARAMVDVASASDWHLTLMAKQYCPLAPGVPIESPYQDSCAQWQEAAAEELLRDPPDLLVTSQEDYRALGDDGEILDLRAGAQALGTAQRQLYRELLAAGTTIAVIRNTPRAGIDMGACLTENADDITACAIPRKHALRGVGAAQKYAVQDLDDVRLIDLTDSICPTRRCAPVIGSVLVFQDANHMTTTYGQSLAPRLAAQLPGAARL